ncbi:site-specific integrase, partial [Emergencia timonensis]
PSDAKEWALRMKDKGFSYNTINNHKRSLKASFYIAIQDDCVRKNPFDFKLSEVIENDTKEKVALTEEQEQALLSFIKTDNVYHKYYDDVLILLKTGLRISELCGLTV